ncbi:MAG: hypothetical protein WD603_03015 [Patescibacteria group bacterium]
MSVERGSDHSHYDEQASEARRRHAEHVEDARREHRRDVSATRRKAKVTRGRVAIGGVAAAATVAGAGEMMDRQIEHDTLRGERHAPIAEGIEQRTQEQALRQEAYERMKREGKIDAEVLRPKGPAADTPAESPGTGLTGRDGTVDIDGVTGSVELDQGADYEATSGIIPGGIPEAGGSRYPAAPEDHSGETGGATAG